MKKVIFLITILLCYTILLKSQSIAVDGNGDDVYVNYTAAEPKLSFSTGTPSIQVGYAIPLKQPYYYYLTGNPNDSTVGKSWSLAIDYSLKSNSDILSLTNFPIKPTHQISIGIQNTIDTIFNMNRIRNLRGINGFTKAWGLNLNIDINNIDILQDTSTMKVQNKKPVSVGFTFNYAAYKLKWIGFNTIISFNYGNNASDLNSYINRNDTSNVIIYNDKFVAFKSATGKYGLFDNRLISCRVSTSFPITFPDVRWLKWLGIIPYIVYNGADLSNKIERKNDLRGGVSFAFFGKQVSNINRNIVEGFNISVEFDNDTKANVFLTGTASIANLFKRTRNGVSQ